jgi:uncharacterized membrane protein YgcG
MSPTNCVHCGKEAGEGELYCGDCQAISATPRRKGLWVFTIAFSALILFLTGLVLWHGGFSFGSLSLDSIWGRQAAVINGESISKADLKARLKTIQGIVERQHGKDIFVGERGRALWANLQNAVLNEMLEEKLVSQEGRKLGVQITEEQVQQKLDQIIKEDFGTWENFQTRLQEEGMSKEDLQENIRNLLLVEAIKKVKAQEGFNPDSSFNAWLTQARQEAKVTLYNSGNSTGVASALAGGCCSTGGSSGGCSGGGGTARQADPRIEREAQTAALEAFQKSNPAEKSVTAKVTDYGCHIQVDIQKEGRVIKSYSYQNGKVEEES